MENQNEKLTKEVHDNFSSDNFDRCLELADENVEITAHAINMNFKGKDEFRNFMMSFKSAFPDMKLIHKNILSSGNKTAVEFIAEATHTGTLQTPAGDIPPSGNKIKLNVSEFYEWENGKFKKMSNYQDIGSLMRQIGALK